jgi:YfiH family protein
MNDLVRFKCLSEYKEISHCYTTKKGGVSNGVFASLNMGFNRGDDKEKVLENYKLVCKELGIDEKNLVLSNQVHKDTIKYVTKDDIGKGIYRESDILEVDGLMTDVKGVGIVTFYADCVPLLFYDPIHHVIACSHAGWRGTVLKIGAKTISEMSEKFNTKPEIKDISEEIGGISYWGVGKICSRMGEKLKDKKVARKVVKIEKEIDLKMSNVQTWSSPV